MNLYILSSINPIYILLEMNNIVFDVKIENKNFLETLDLKILDLLNQFNANIKNIKNIYIDIGPGNLTSLKICASFILGLILNENINLFTFSCFDLLKDYKDNMDKNNNKIFMLKANSNSYYVKYEKNKEIIFQIIKKEENILKNNLINFFSNDQSLSGNNFFYQNLYYSLIYKKITNVAKKENKIKIDYIKDYL